MPKRKPEDSETGKGKRRRTIENGDSDVDEDVMDLSQNPDFFKNNVSGFGETWIK